MTVTVALPMYATKERKGHAAAKTNATLLEIIDGYCNCNKCQEWNDSEQVVMVHEALVTPPLSSDPSH